MQLYINSEIILDLKDASKYVKKFKNVTVHYICIFYLSALNVH